MKREPKLLGCYNYTVILTYIGMLFGFGGILSAMEDKLLNAFSCLMVAGVCDMFDGAIAATRQRTEQEKSFGIQIDSLSDLICFGVLPAVITHHLSQKGIVSAGICTLYLLCALIRLAWFNVDEQERQTTDASPRSLYFGLPVTLSALFVPSLYSLSRLCLWNMSAVLHSALLVMGTLFLIPFPLKKPKLPGKLCIVLCGMAEVLLVALACAGR